MTPLETYLARMLEIRSSGHAQPETSYYGPLETLFNEIGSSLKPKVRCNMSSRTLPLRTTSQPAVGENKANLYTKRTDSA